MATKAVLVVALSPLKQSSRRQETPGRTSSRLTAPPSPRTNTHRRPNGSTGHRKTWRCSTPAWLASSVWGLGTARHAGTSFGSLQYDMLPTARATQLQDLAAAPRPLAPGLMASGHRSEAHRVGKEC